MAGLREFYRDEAIRTAAVHSPVNGVALNFGMTAEQCRRSWIMFLSARCATE